MSVRTWLVAVGLLFASSLARADGPPIEQAIKDAAAAKKPLVLEFGAQWCGPCKEFAAKTLPDPRVQSALKLVSFVQYDVDEDAGGIAAEKYGVHSYPTFLIVDKQGVEVVRQSGAPLGEGGIKSFVEWLLQARMKAADENDIRATMKAAPNDPDVHLAAGHWFAAHKKAADAVAAYEKVSLNKKATQPQRLEATSAMVGVRRRDQWSAHMLAEKKALVRALPAAARDEDLIIATVGSGLSNAEVRGLWKPVLDAEPDADKLNHLIYIALAAGANEEALAAAERLVQLRRTAQFLDTLAECHHVNHQRAKAMTIEDEAIDLAKGAALEKELRSNRIRFELGTGEVKDTKLIKTQAETFWKRLNDVDRLPKATDAQAEGSDPASKMDPRQMAMFKQFRAEHDLAVAVAKACAVEAFNNDEAVARIEIGDDGTIKSTVLLLEPNAKAALGTCLTKQIVGAKIIEQPARAKSRLNIDFHHAH